MARRGRSTYDISPLHSCIAFVPVSRMGCEDFFLRPFSPELLSLRAFGVGSPHTDGHLGIWGRFSTYDISPLPESF